MLETGLPIHYYRTSAGTFLITERLGRWHIIFDDESLGGYATPQQAADDLTGWHIFSPGRGIDTSKLDIPRDLEEWDKGPPR